MASRFEDLDHFISEQQTLVKEANRKSISLVEQGRLDNDDVIRASFQTLADYYETILKPRTDLLPVLKKKEDPICDPKTYGHVHYEYVANFLPEKARPYRGSDSPFADYWRAGEISHEPWHPNVALQLDFRLIDKYDHNQRAYVGLIPRIYVLVWGVIQQKEGSVLDPDISLAIGNSHYKDYSSIAIFGNTDNVEKTSANIQNALTMASPNVLNHVRIVKGERL